MAVLKTIAHKLTKVNILGDFTISVPGGMAYSTDPEFIGEDRVLVFMKDARADYSSVKDGGTGLAILAPQNPCGSMDFTDPIVKGVIRNFVSRLFEEIYQQQVPQVRLRDDPDLIVLYAKKSAEGTVHVVIAGTEGLYECQIFLPGKTDKERFEVVEAWLSTIEKYHPEEKAKKKTDEAKVPDGEEKESGDEPDPSAEGQKMAEDDETLNGNTQESASDIQETDDRSQEAGEKDTAKEPADGNEGEEAAVRTTDTTDKEKANEDKAVADEKAILHELEEQRAEKIRKLRAQYAGNSDVESQIDNYIPRVQRSSERVVEEFRSFINQMHNYISTVYLTGPDDPNYIEIAKRIKDAQTTLGSQLDEMIDNVDENAENARSAGITEYYVERLIRLVERIEERYADLDVTMYDGSTLSYKKSEEVSDVIRKWKNVRQALPSYIEKSGHEVEKQVTEDLNRKIERTKTQIRNQEAFIELKIEEARTAEENVTAAEKALARFDERRDDRSEEIRSQAREEQRFNQEQTIRVQQELEDREQELVMLTDELDRTFSLAVGKRKDLAQKIDLQNGIISELKAQVEMLARKRPELENAGEDRIRALDDERAELLKRIEDANRKVGNLHRELDRAEQKRLALQKTAADCKEELGHIHENYLRGKYDKE